MKLVPFIFLICVVASSGWAGGKCKMNIRTTTTDGDSKHVKLDVEVSDALDEKDCKAQARAKEVNNSVEKDPDHQTTIKVTFGFKPDKPN